MLEEEKDGLVFGEEALNLFGDGGAVVGRVVGLAEAEVDEVGGDDFGGLEILRFGAAETGVALLE